ncbi:PQQ-binding-like beta-propeller repeat protein [Salipaludibacillus aurantiacus]|uniref:PQQ-like domain-containing protein n=1 Tax=Salipaludibacillus aurantiacus TaxID=1601833 RepID=A0A1H9T6J5_9BACI|nr:PQQ-binding-like beta-propeller repeat protein [Salipaludibacillus aurantiacus]SER92842.1 hypothetical protein SAMN05518684_105151 [Salipaludibacillus aurantiacus]
MLKLWLLATFAVILSLSACNDVDQLTVSKEETENQKNMGEEIEKEEREHSGDNFTEDKQNTSERVSAGQSDKYEPIVIEEYFRDHIEFQLEKGDVVTEPDEVMFPENYTELEGVLTFRGGPWRDRPSYGSISASSKMVLEEQWEFTTGHNEEWGGGAGWTGQPAIIKWDEEIRKVMNIKEEFKEKENFVEIIQGSLDGNIYFFDLESGKQSREPIKVQNPIKGSVSVDSRGYPLLYQGDGVPRSDDKKGEDNFGFNIFSLLNGELLHHIDGRDEYAHREWGAFDGSALINRETDTLITGGENGIFYNIKLNTVFDKGEGSISISPEEQKMRYEIEDNDYQGIENSVAVYKNMAFFADNGGSILAVNLADNKPIWALPPLDDTDSTIVMEIIDDVPFLYTGTEVDIQGENGDAYLRKINGITGEVVWQKSYFAYYYPGVVGGVLATPVLGKKSMDGLIIYTIARHQGVYEGIMVALDRETGEEVWRWETDDYAWSSPVDIYNENGEGFLIQADFGGNLHLLNGLTGEVLDSKNFGHNIEASPAVYNDKIVFASRSGKIHQVKIK